MDVRAIRHRATSVTVGAVRLRRVMSASAIALAVGSAGVAHAQVSTSAPESGSAQPATSSAAPSQASAGNTVQEVVVTAERRATNIQTTAISITAVSGAQLQEKQVVTISDLQSEAPGFSFTNSGQMARNMILHDPAADSRRFDPKAQAPALKALSAQMDASDPDLTAFAAHGGKLLLMHGTVDMAVTPHNTVAYWERIGAAMGEARRRRFARFYVAPGFGHGDGPFVVGWDSLKTLDDWVDRKIAPPGQLAFDTNAATKGRARPLCEFPGWPRYEGGDPSSASSFACVVS